MKRTRKQGFIHGAAILAVAGIAVKIIGACYKIPLGAILGPVGMADFSIAYNIYALLFVLSTAGVPAAVSKMVSESAACGAEERVYQIYKVSYYAFATAGIVGFTVMFFGADMLAEFMGNRDASLSVKAISPAVVFVTLSAINRGYFQGRADMRPTAASEMIEALGKLIFGLCAAWYMKKIGLASEKISAGAVLGVSAGALLSALYFAMCKDKTAIRDKKSTVKNSEILKELFSLAIPITFGAAVISLTNVIDSALVMNLLQKCGAQFERAKWLFGAYSYATTVFNLPSAMVTTVSVSILPALSGLKAKKDYIGMNNTVNTGIFAAMMISIPAAFGLGALSEDIIALLYGAGIDAECIKTSGMLLKCLAAAVPLLAITTVTNSIHQSMGSVHVPVLSMLFGAVIKLVSNFILVGKASVNIYGAAISTVLCYSVITILNIIALRKYPFVKVDIIKNFVCPTLLGVVTFLSVTYFKHMITGVFGSGIQTILCVFVGVVTCGVTAFAMGMPGNIFRNISFCKKKIFKIIDND